MAFGVQHLYQDLTEIGFGVNMQPGRHPHWLGQNFAAVERRRE
jgi:hypothetical protein